MRTKIIVFILIVFCCGCSKEMENKEEVLWDNTVAGGPEYVKLNGNMQISAIGIPYTEEEIMMALESDMEFLESLFESGSYLSKNGYYHVTLYDELLRYQFFVLPVVKDGKIIGDITISRVENEMQFASNEYVSNYVLNDILAKKGEVAMIYSVQSQYAISSDNEVFTIYGNDSPVVENVDNLYSAFAMKNNIASEKIFDESEYYYKWE